MHRICSINFNPLRSYYFRLSPYLISFSPSVSSCISLFSLLPPTLEWLSCWETVKGGRVVHRHDLIWLNIVVTPVVCVSILRDGWSTEGLQNWKDVQTPCLRCPVLLMSASYESWHSPGIVEVKGKVKGAQLCPTLCNPMDSTVHGILQARVLEQVAFPFSRGSSQPRDWTQISHVAGGFFTN